MEFYELIIDRTTFNSGWEKKNRCGWCEAKINISDEQYRLKGNICAECITMLNKKYQENMDKEMKQRKQEKEFELTRLGTLLEQDISENARATIEEKMKKLHNEIKTYEIHHED